jgi:Uma2 family endonuclease
MATVTPPQAAGMSAEQFARRPDPGCPEELVEGRAVRMPPPGARHGQLCNRLGRLIGNFAEENDLGHVLSNDSGIVTRRGPDTVRGADVAFYSYARLPKGPLPALYPAVVPDLVVEVRSPHEGWPAVLAKVAEYLEAGVGAVCVLDDETRTAQVFDAERPVRVVTEPEALEFPGVLPGFRVALGRVFG